jgi:NitT/TauT family transport system permease protein
MGAVLPSHVRRVLSTLTARPPTLLAGEIIGGIAGYSLGQQLAVSRDFGLIADLYATMIVLFVIGVVIDAAVFGTADRKIRKRYGLIDAAAT